MKRKLKTNKRNSVNERKIFKKEGRKQKTMQKNSIGNGKIWQKEDRHMFLAQTATKQIVFYNCSQQKKRNKNKTCFEGGSNHDACDRDPTTLTTILHCHWRECSETTYINRRSTCVSLEWKCCQFCFFLLHFSLF